MRQTLFFIPHSWFDGPLLWGWLILSVGVMGFLVLKKRTHEIFSLLPVLGIGALGIYFLLPRLEIYGVNPEDPLGPFIKQGLAIRGYGVCMLLAIVAGVGITLHRCRQTDVDPERILSLAFWMIICGILGARSLYVIQKSGEFFQGQAPLGETLASVLDMTKGGLVVYGSLIGGMIAALVFFRITKLPLLKTADLIAPGMVLGLALGRIGCLMNGCCYGGLCESQLPSLCFPAGSPPYMQQLQHGDLVGVRTQLDPQATQFLRVVTEVQPGGTADRAGVEVGDSIDMLTLDSERTRFFQSIPEMMSDNENSPKEPVVYIHSKRQGYLAVPLRQLSRQSLPVHPTQVYSSVNAALLALLLWLYWPLRTRDGEVFGWMLVLYPMARFLLEMIRRDESGLFGTSLTISQWVSIGTLILGLCWIGWVRTRQENTSRGIDGETIKPGKSVVKC